MDEAPQPAERLPLQGPHWHRGPEVELPPDFHPLRLLLQSGGHSIELTRPDMILGRHSEADVRLPLADVSRRHCRFAFLNGLWQVFDLNSLNGTFVNGQRVRHAVLKHRDLVRMGGFTFEVQLQRQHPTVQLPNRPAGEGVLHRIAEALPPEQNLRRAS
jgi:pSer/pThr/pTyr-binding forkhead associated (FHA) protein